MLTREELAALKPGDEVAWKRSSSGAWHITTVAKVGATSILTTDHERWTAKAGKRFGGTRFDRDYLQRVTQEARDAIEKQALVARLYRIEWDRHDLAALRRIAAIVEGRRTKPPAHAHNKLCAYGRCYPAGDENPAGWDKLRGTVEGMTDEELEICGLRRIEEGR